jgi:hypothetical protein
MPIWRLRGLSTRLRSVERRPQLGPRRRQLDQERLDLGLLVVGAEEPGDLVAGYDPHGPRHLVGARVTSMTGQPPANDAGEGPGEREPESDPYRRLCDVRDHAVGAVL